MQAEGIDQAMSRYAEGHEPSFEILYDHLSPRLMGYLKNQTRDNARAEDLLQQTFLQIHRTRGAFRPGAPVVPWAFAIARRLAIDAARKSRFEVPGEHAAFSESPATDPLPDALMSAKQLDGRLSQELAKLPESQRTAFSLIQQEGLSTAEAAAVLGTTVSAVKLRAHRAYQVLRTALGEVFDRPEVKG